MNAGCLRFILHLLEREAIANLEYRTAAASATELRLYAADATAVNHIFVPLQVLCHKFCRGYNHDEYNHDNLLAIWRYNLIEIIYLNLNLCLFFTTRRTTRLIETFLHFVFNSCILLLFNLSNHCMNLNSMKYGNVCQRAELSACKRITHTPFSADLVA